MNFSLEAPFSFDLEITMLWNLYQSCLQLLIFYAAVLFKWHSNSIFLWHCDVPLHMAQCNREFEDHHKVRFFKNFIQTIVMDLFCSNYCLPCRCQYFTILQFSFHYESLQACFCDFFICRRDFYISLRWYGCSRH